MMQIQVFVTAYDPSDLPRTSIDPLGFERRGLAKVIDYVGKLKFEF